MQLYLIRHPEPVDAHGTCYGRMDLRIEARSWDRGAAVVRLGLEAAEACAAL